MLNKASSNIAAQSIVLMRDTDSAIAFWLLKETQDAVLLPTLSILEAVTSEVPGQ